MSHIKNPYNFNIFQINLLHAYFIQNSHNFYLGISTLKYKFTFLFQFDNPLRTAFLTLQSKTGCLIKNY